MLFLLALLVSVLSGHLPPGALGKHSGEGSVRGLAVLGVPTVCCGTCGTLVTTWHCSQVIPAYQACDPSSPVHGCAMSFDTELSCCPPKTGKAMSQAVGLIR